VGFAVATIGGGGKGRVIARWWELPAMVGIASRGNQRGKRKREGGVESS
jgi:hypothetical protein